MSNLAPQLPPSSQAPGRPDAPPPAAVPFPQSALSGFFTEWQMEPSTPHAKPA